MSRWEGKAASHSELTKNLSMLTSVGCSLSLLQVKRLFLHLISFKPAVSIADLNLPIILLLRLRLFLSLAS